MIAKLYIRVAQFEDQLIIKASPNVNNEALTKRVGRTNYICPTVSFAIEVDIPEEMFEQAEKVIARVAIDSEEIEICDIIKTFKRPVGEE